MRIEKDMKLADVIHHDFSLIPVINRFGIHLGFGDGTIEEICEDKEVNTEFFLTILNTYHDAQYFPKKHLQSFHSATLIEYLRKAHQFYLEQKIPAIKKLICKLTEESDQNKDTYQLAANFFNEYELEFTKHIDREENVVYPYVYELEKAIKSGKASTELLDQMTSYSIMDYEDEHDNVEEKLFDLKNLIIKYLPAPKNESTSYKILLELFELEKDLREHARIEDMILVPKVEAMEFTIQKMSS
ncbi:MAG: hemerythrin domain-containing protein [Bacteroidales bacterium]|nr:hemerythrin domain-containing protein [Bacteroidales bacterium]